MQISARVGDALMAPVELAARQHKPAARPVTLREVAACRAGLVRLRARMAGCMRGGEHGLEAAPAMRGRMHELRLVLDRSIKMCLCNVTFKQIVAGELGRRATSLRSAIIAA